MAANYENNPAIANFVEYLKIPSVQPDINYDDCVAFLKKQANGLSLAVKVYELVPRKPIVILTWPGKDQSLGSILLNSHMDVVPVFENSWTYPPFSGHIDKDGKIYARGSQDMKCVGIQYLEAIRKLKAAGVQLKRTLHVCFVPDEEIGGHDGMEKFVHTKDFKDLNVEFALDEGMASPNEDFVLFNGERSIWQIHVHCTGQPGHGSLLLPNTAGEKLRYIIDKFMDLRAEQKKILDSNPKLTIGDVTTINLTQIYGGVQSNVVPEKLTAVFDIRLAVTVNHEEFEDMINKWCKEAGDGVTFDFEQKNHYVEVTKLDASNPFWLAFKAAADELYNDACVATDPFVPTHTTIIKKCKCKQQEPKRQTNYKKKSESEKMKRGPKPKPKQDHQCYQCDKQFRCQAQLEMHVSKRFSAQGNLHAHLKIHTGQRDHKLHKLKKHQIVQQNSKLQNEGFNNSGNIDIIGIDVGKEPPMKDVGHLIPHLINEKPQQNLPVIPENQPLMPFEQKTKEMFHQYPTKVFEVHNCAICGEGFDYVTALAQHYLHQHKDHENIHSKIYGLSH
ncbi:unnamed protein product [Spodoptera exigua]|nr:unnamed protein product [Spodoptera exigua]